MLRRAFFLKIFPKLIRKGSLSIVRARKENAKTVFFDSKG